MLAGTGFTQLLDKITTLALLPFSFSSAAGAEGLPQGMGTRFFFWFFYVSMVTVFAAYSAMLVSFLAVQNVVLPFEDVEGLLKDGTYQLGILSGTSQLDFFRVNQPRGVPHFGYCQDEANI